MEITIKRLNKKATKMLEAMRKDGVNIREYIEGCILSYNPKPVKVLKINRIA